MKILLTGACGVLGKAIQRVGAEHHTFVLMDSAKGNGVIQACISDDDEIMRAAEGCDAIIHTAAMHGSSRTKESNARFININVVGAEHIFQAALKHGIRRIVVSSTMEVLIGQNWDAHGKTVVDESFSYRPDWIYPVTKVQVEQLGSFYAQTHGLEVVSLRYMAFDSRPVSRLKWGLLARCVWVDDVAVANLLAVTRPNLQDEVFNIGPDTPLTQNDIDQAMTDPWQVLERHWPGCRRLIEPLRGTPKLDCFWPVTRIDKAKRMLGWQVRGTFASYLKALEPVLTIKQGINMGIGMDQLKS